MWWILGAVTLLVFLSLLTAFICFMRIFYLGKAKLCEEEFPLPRGKAYEPYYDEMVGWIKEVRKMKYTDVSVKSFDGLTLRGKYFEPFPGAPIEILFHGYRGSSERDLIGGVLRCRALGRNALLVDQRAGGRSEGRVTTFGAKESRDCLSWVDLVINNINKDAKVILTGVSMGAATVMIAASKDMPKNVVGVLADCGYSSAEDIIKKVMQDMRLPSALLMPFVRLGARLFGGFRIEDASPVDAMRKAKIPVIFIHGDSDDFVPHQMSVDCYNACVSKKQLVTVNGAGHGLAFPVNSEKYMSSLNDFFNPLLI